MKNLSNTEKTDKTKNIKTNHKNVFLDSKKKKWVAISKSTIFLPSQATLSKLAISQKLLDPFFKCKQSRHEFQEK
jgi:hypothetical protein